MNRRTIAGESQPPIGPCWHCPLEAEQVERTRARRNLEDPRTAEDRGGGIGARQKTETPLKPHPSASSIRACAMVLLAACSCATLPARSPAEDRGPVELVRDRWGIPHVFAETDAGAFYGLGWATAEDRGLQMTLALRMVQGRLAEDVGLLPKTNREEIALDHDTKMRTFGFARSARRAAEGLDPETRGLLQAYCDGVNDWFAANRNDLHPLFAKYGLAPEPWSPAECIASWWHLGQFFATDGTRELIAGRSRAPGAGPMMPPDEEPAVVQRSDLPDAWVEEVRAFARAHGLGGERQGEEGAKFSHAWVVGGRRSTTGSAVLVSDPQTQVRNPSLFYEFHFQGRTFNARGLGVPGSPVVLIGFTEQVAWGVTALGADQADLFRLETDPARPDHYRFDGAWRPMTVHREKILVRGREPVEWTVRETHLGPVATRFCLALPAEGEVALRRIPLCEPDRETIQGALAMLRARDAAQFDAALAGWRFPSVNILFGDSAGRIGFRALAAIPVRSRLDPSAGRHAAPGRRSAEEWQGIVPHRLLPGVMDPVCGFLYSANHRPIGAWYPIPLGAMTGAGGDTVRSWRLRELLSARERFAPEDVLAIHRDAVNPARRTIVGLAGLIRERGVGFSEDADRALDRLGPWQAAGACSSLAAEGAALALELNTFFRITATELALLYGGGESGLAYFLKNAAALVGRSPTERLLPLEHAFLDQALAGAWRSARGKYGPDPSLWNDRARKALGRRRLGYLESLDGFPSLDPALDLACPELEVPDGGAIACQTAQSYTQWVPMHDPDQALSILPIGSSERPGNPARTSTLELWARGGLHPAPLSRKAVAAIALSRRVLAE